MLKRQFFLLHRGEPGSWTCISTSFSESLLLKPLNGKAMIWDVIEYIVLQLLKHLGGLAIARFWSSERSTERYPQSCRLVGTTSALCKTSLDVRVRLMRRAGPKLIFTKTKYFFAVRIDGGGAGNLVSSYWLATTPLSSSARDPVVRRRGSRFIACNLCFPIQFSENA